MYCVAICDDDQVFISYIKKIIKECSCTKPYQLKFYEFCSGEELVDSLDGLAQIDLLVLDMELGGINGDMTAGLFRKKFIDAVLVFCSGVRPPTVTSFKATPYRYLLKSYTDRQLMHEMKEIMAEVEKKSKIEYILGHYRSNVIKVKIKNILYIENAKRGSKITVCANCQEAEFDGQILVDDKLEILSQEFSDLVFAHNSYIININHIEKIVDNNVYLDNGECLSASRTYQKIIREKFTKSIADKYK